MKQMLSVVGCMVIAGCAGRVPNASDSPRTWLPGELQRAATVQVPQRSDAASSGGTRYAITLNACTANLVSQAYDVRDAGIARPGPAQFSIPLASLAASADGNSVRLTASEAALKRADAAPDVYGAARALWNRSPMTLVAASDQSAARVASGFNELAAECSAAK